MRTLPRSPVYGSSAAARYARQAKLVTAIEWVLPQEPAADWFFVSQSSPFSRAAASALSESSARAGAAQHARDNAKPHAVKRCIAVPSGRRVCLRGRPDARPPVCIDVSRGLLVQSESGQRM